LLGVKLLERIEVTAPLNILSGAIQVGALP
jgi:hypothetical protein